MSRPSIEDYALIGDLRSAALVSRDGSIDWLCLPRFDSEAVFAALLGDEKNGFWRVGPTEPVLVSERRYHGDNLVLQTDLTTATGTLRVTDFMAPTALTQSLVREAVCLSGHVRVRSDWRARFDYGRLLPRTLIRGDALVALAGPHAVYLRSNVTREAPPEVCEFWLSAGQRNTFVMSYRSSHEPPPEPIDFLRAEQETYAYWRNWTQAYAPPRQYGREVLRSLITIKALTYEPTGGIVAAPTTSLPEEIGGVRNWDYRYAWLRDASMTLHALLRAGFRDEARSWRNWLVRAVAGEPAQAQIMYGVAGEHRLTEVVLPHLAGYRDSAPVRIGNGAVDQLQLDVFGELATCVYVYARLRQRLGPTDADILRELARITEAMWQLPDRGVWEVRGPARHFTSSKLSAWVAFDRILRAARRFGLSGPVEHWAAMRAKIASEILTRGYDRERNTFTQSYGSHALDASLLMLPIAGFLPAKDPRVVGTIDAIERHLVRRGLVMRYVPEREIEGVPGSEGTFLACSFWLVECLALAGRREQALELFDRLVHLCNDVGLLAEEYDPRARRALGNFPQALSHLGLVHAAYRLFGGGASWLGRALT